MNMETQVLNLLKNFDESNITKLFQTVLYNQYQFQLDTILDLGIQAFDSKIYFESLDLNKKFDTQIASVVLISMLSICILSIAFNLAFQVKYSKI